MTPSTATNEIRQLFDRYADTYATHDVDAVVALHAPDSQFWLHLDNEPAVGREAIAETFARFFAQWPNFGFEVYGIFTGPDHWVLDWALTAELTRPDGTAVPVRFDCVDIVTVNVDGLLARKDTFVDYVQAQRALAAAA
jgi:uncharacterized protein (TIGR02246 family)